MSQRTDLNFLFAVFALKTDIIDRDQFRRCLEVSGAEQAGGGDGAGLEQRLVDDGVLTADESGLVRQLVELYLQRHDGDVAAGLAAISGSLLGPAELQGILQELPVEEVGTSGGEASLFATIVSADFVKPPGTTTSSHDSSVAPASLVEASSVGVAGGRVRFEVLRKHAQGGLGDIFVARDRELNRDVALKEIQEKFSHDQASRRRFVMEGEVTGSLEHPGVVPVYGMGTDGDGRPYYAMRLIRGESLQDAIASFHSSIQEGDEGKRTLTLRKLLGRFIDVCNTVHYAHSRGVLHRDLKPDNVMLGPYGETLVVDWGLAKIIGRAEESVPESTEQTLQPESSSGGEHTRHGAVVGTLQYMSPEQALGWHDQLTPAADIFSLGAILYKMLVNDTVHTGAKLAELHQKAIECNIVPVRQLNRELPAPLAAICEKATAKSVEDRYRSALQLAEDIEAFLADEPVLARPDPRGVRTLRWMRRHRTFVTAVISSVVVTLLGLLSSIALLSWKNAEVASQRDAAVANLRSARNAVWESFVKISDEERLQAEGLEELRLDLLKAPEPYYREFLSQTPDDPELRLEQARWRMRLGSNVYDAATRAEALTHFDRARELLESLVAQQPDVPIYRRFLAKTLGATGQIYADLDDFSRANEKYRTAIATLGQLPDMEDDGRDGEATSADDLESAAGLHVKMLALMGDNLQRIGEFDAARRVYTEAMEMQLTYRDQYVGDLALWLPKPKVADAVALLPDGEYREALELLEQALRDMEMLQISTGDRDDVQYFRAQAINQMGVLYTDSSRPHAARRCFQEAYSLAVPVADRRPGNVMFAELAADLKNNINVPLSQVHVAGETEDFVKRQQAAIVAAQRLLERNPDVTANRVSLARMRRMLAVHYLAQQAYVDARAELALAEQHMRKATESSPDVVAYAVQEIWIMLNTADVLFAQDDLPAAVEKCEWAVRQARAWLDRRNNVYFRNALIDALMRLSQYAGAVEDWPTAQQRLVARMEAIEGHPDGFRQVPMFRDLKASTLQLMAQIAFRTNDPQRGFELQEQALALRKELVVDYPDEPHLVFYLSALHETMSASLMEYGGLLSIGKAAEHALASSEAVKGIDAQYLPIDRLEGLANSESYLAQFARGGNRIDDALQHLQNASRFAHLLYDSRRESSTLVFRADCEIQIGELHAEKGQHGAAVLSFDAALALGEQVVLEHAGNEHAVNERARQLRARAYLRRGQSLENLGQYREALAAIEQAVEVGGGEDPVESRIARARLQARMGEHAKAVTQIVATLALNGIDATDQLHAADVYALAKAAAQRDLAIDEALRSQLVDDYAAKAMERLRAAEVDGALRDETAWERLRTNENLSSLRGLPAFEQFLNHPNPTKEQSFGD